MIATLNIAGFLTIFAYNYSTTNTNAKLILEVRDKHFPLLQLTDNNIHSLEKIKESLISAITTGDMELIKESQTLANNIDDNFNKMKSISPGHGEEIKTMEQIFFQYFNDAKPLSISLIDGSADLTRFDQNAEVMTQKLKACETAFKQFRSNSYKIFASSIDNTIHDFNFALLVNVVVGVVVMTILALSLYYLFSTILKKIYRIINSLQAMAQGSGDLTRRLPGSGEDEIGNLVESFNRFVEKLREILIDIRNTSNPIQQVSHSIASENSAIAQRSQQQFDRIESTSANIEMISKAVKESAVTAEEANTLANSALSQAKEGSEVITQTISAMDQINQSSDRIAAIIDVIDGIAFQTNLLALNASVEAARAGENGRGFAVVASEVRGLAQRSTDAAKEISQLIKDSSEKVAAGYDLVNKTGETFKDIEIAVECSTQRVFDIANTSSEQSQSIERLKEAIFDLHNMARQVSEMVKQAAEASTNMRQQASILADRVNFFKLNQ